MWEKIQILLKDVEKCFKAATSTKTGKLTYREPEPSKKMLDDEKQLQEAFDWLQKFVGDDIESFMFIYERHMPDVWQNYLDLDYAKSLTEYQQLQGFARSIKATWRTRPKILKARKHGKRQEVQEQEATLGDAAE